MSNEEFVHNYVNHMAPASRRQLPVFAHVGKGIPGNGFIIDVDYEDDDTVLVGKIIDNWNDEVTEAWRLSFADLVPVLHYELWTGVRIIDDVLCYVYWYKIKAVTTVDQTEITLWEFTTPYVKRFEYSAEDEPPADTKIDEG